MSNTEPTNVAVSPSDPWQQQERELARITKEVLLANKTALFDALAAAGITTVIVNFDGYGDSGQVERIEAGTADGDCALPAVEVEIASANWGSVAIDRQTRPIREAIETLVYDVLNQTHGGWENNFKEAAMGHPYHHALSSVRIWGGSAEDYLPLHQWFDESKAITADFRHRALRHHAEGIFMLERFFGPTITLSTGRVVPVRLIGEQHVREDLGFIPSFADWVRCIRPEPWMGRAQPIRRNVDPFAIGAQDERTGALAEGGPAHAGDH